MPSFRDGAFGTDTLIPGDKLQELQSMLHDLIKARAGQLPSFPMLQLPDLTKHLHGGSAFCDGEGRGRTLGSSMHVDMACSHGIDMRAVNNWVCM